VTSALVLGSDRETDSDERTANEQSRHGHSHLLQIFNRLAVSS